MCGGAIVLFWTAYFGAMKICLGFVFVTTTMENIAVLIRPSFHAFTNLWLIESGKCIDNRLASDTQLEKLNANILVIIISLMGTRFIPVLFGEF